MVYRKFNAPNVEYNEIDKSQYGVINNAAVGTMTFIAGFADKGDDYEPKYSNSFSEFVASYGYPTNEAERYFHNAAKEVFSNGGRTVTAKIPYDNESKDKFPFTVYYSDGIVKTIKPNEFGDLLEIDNSITSYFELKSVEKDSLQNEVSSIFDINDSYGLLTIEQYDKLLIGSAKPNENSIYIVDIARNKYSKDPNLTNLNIYQTDKYLGYVPVIVSPINALYFQKIISSDSIEKFNVASNLQTIPNESLIMVDSEIKKMNQVDFSSEISNNFSINIKTSDIESTSVSKLATNYFPSINFYENNRLNKQYLKQIGIVVFKMVSESSNNGKINFIPVESFIGSLNRKDKDPISGRNLFIDDIVNSQSEIINVFSNFNFDTITDLYIYNDVTSSDMSSDVSSDMSSDMSSDFDISSDTSSDMSSDISSNMSSDIIIGKSSLNKASTIYINNQILTTLGFFESQCMKKISSKTIEDTLDLIFEKCKNKNSIPIDIVCDAGVSNIAQYMTTMVDKSIFYEPEYDFNNDYSLTSINSSKEWLKIINKFDNFVKIMRKDCIFIADGIRSLCLNGNEKIIRRTEPKNTILKDIVPKIRYMLPPNSSYSTGYCNWFNCIDSTSMSYYWCPPSIKALGVYLYTDRYANVWDAPAGNNRGVVNGAIDIAFNPTIEEAQYFYNHNWNYAISYPLDGIIIEGQKTFQTEKTSLDRVNVRRLCNQIKKGVNEISRRINYESITESTLIKFREEITDFLGQIKNNNGISEFFVKLDGENNTQETIDRNEIHLAFAIRPIKTAEYIIINSIVTNQSADLEEVTNSVLS